MTSPKPRRRAGEPRPNIFVDLDGVTCVRVPLANCHETALLWKIDYDRLKAAGLSSYWYYASNGRGLRYVSAKRPGFGLLRVARLVLEEEAGFEVRCANHDRLDLRRPNLYVARNPYSHATHASDELSA